MFGTLGEYLFGDGVGCQVGAEAQQVGGGRAFLFDALEGERPGGGDWSRMVFDERAAFLQ